MHMAYVYCYFFLYTENYLDVLILYVHTFFNIHTVCCAVVRARFMYRFL